MRLTRPVQSVTCVCLSAGPPTSRRRSGSRRRSPSAVDLLLGGKLEDKQELAKQASPLTYVSADDPPFLIVHGTADNTVPSSKRDVVRRVEAGRRRRDAGQDPGGSHAVGGEEVLKRVGTFFDKHLRARPSRSPANRSRRPPEVTERLFQKPSG